MTTARITKLHHIYSKGNGAAGVAPLKVSLDFLTSTITDGGFRDALVEVDFGDELGDHNTFAGGIYAAGHTYETPGSYTASVRITDRAGNSSLATIPIEVVEFPVAGLTRYVSAAGSDSNDGLTEATPWLTFDHAAEQVRLLLTDRLPVPVRLLFRRGDTFTTATGKALGHYKWGDPAKFGEYGIGAKPKIHSTSSDPNHAVFSSSSWGLNFSFVDLEMTSTFDSQGAVGDWSNGIGWIVSGDGNPPPQREVNLLVLRCDFRNMGVPVSLSPFQQNTSWDYADNFGVFDCMVRDCVGSFYSQAKHQTIVGNDVRQTHSHCIRSEWLWASLIAGNTFFDPGWSTTHVSPGAMKLGAPLGSSPKRYSQYFCVQDNHTRGGRWAVALDAQNDAVDQDQEMRDWIVERNLFEPAIFHDARGTQINFRTGQGYGTIRNNVIRTGERPGDLNAQIVVRRHPSPLIPAPTDLEIYNNIGITFDDAPLEQCEFLRLEGLGIRRVAVRNNLCRYRGLETSAFLRFYNNDANNLPIHALIAEEANTFWRPGLTSTVGNWLVDDGGSNNTLDQWQQQGAPFGTRSKVEEALFTSLATLDLRLTAASPGRVDGDLLPALWDDRAGELRARPGSGMTVSRGAHEANPGGGNNAGKLLQTISLLNMAAEERDDLTMCGVALAQGELREGTDLLMEGSTGQQEHVQWSKDWFPAVEFSPGNEALSWTPQRWPDGSIRFARIEFPAHMAAAANPATLDFAEQVASLKIGTASTKPAAFSTHVDVTAGLADLRIGFSAQVVGEDREEVFLRWSDFARIEAGLNQETWHCVKRLTGIRGSLWVRAIVKLLRGQKHARVFVLWGNSHVTYGTGRVGDAYPDDHLTLAGPVTLRFLGETPTLADVVFRAHGDKVDSRSAQTVGSVREVSYVLLNPSYGPSYATLATGLVFKYRGVMLFGAEDATQRAEQVQELVAESRDLTNRLPPWFNTAPYPSFITSRADGVERMKRLFGTQHMLWHPSSTRNLRDPYHQGHYGGNPEGGNTGPSNAFGSDHLWPDIRTGYPMRLPLLLASSLQAMWPHGHFEVDGRPARFEAMGTATIRWGGGIWSVDSSDWWGRRNHRVPPVVQDLIPRPTVAPFSQTRAQAWRDDEQHWDRHFEFLTAFITCDPLVTLGCYQDMVRTIQIDHPDAASDVIARIKEERGAGRFLKNHVLAWWLFGGSDPVIGAFLERKMNHPDPSKGYLARIASHNWTQSGRWAGLAIQPFAIRSGSQQTTLPNSRNHTSVWMHAIHEPGFIALANTSLPGSAEMLRHILDMAAWIAREGWLHWNAPWQVFGLITEQTPARTLPHSQRSGWNDETLAGRTVTGDTSLATGRLVCAYRGGDPGPIVIADCVGEFRSGEVIRLSGAGDYSARISFPRDPMVALSLYATGEGTPNGGQFLTWPQKEETVFDTVNTQEQGWRLANILIGHFYTEENVAAAVIAKWGAEEGLYPIESRQLVLDAANLVISNLLAGRVDNGAWGTGANQPRFLDEWLTILPGAFGTITPEPRPPAAPSDLTLEGVSSTDLQSRWRDNSGNETGFVLELSAVSENGPWEPAITLPVNATERLITSRPVGKQQWGRIAAFNQHGTSAWSPVATGTTMGVPKPNVPANFMAIGQPLRARLTWEPDLNATGTEVHFHNGADWLQLAVLSASVAEAFDTNFTVGGSSRDYRVRHYRDISGQQAHSDWSPIATVTVLDPPVVGTVPAAPTLLTAPTVGSNGVHLFWQRNATDETFVQPQRKDGAGEWMNLDPLPTGTTNFIDTTVVPGTVSSWRIYNVNDLGLSDPSNTVTETIPSVEPEEEIDPPVIAAVATGPMLVEVTITLPPQEITGLYLERLDLTTGDQAVLTLDAETVLYQDRSVLPQHDYEYQARAFHENGLISGYSNVEEITTPAPGSPPAIPILTATPHATLSQIACSWPAADGATGYRLWLWDPELETWSLAADQATLSFLITGLRRGTQYLVYVEAYNDDGVAESAIIMVTTFRPLPRAIVVNLSTSLVLELEG